MVGSIDFSERHDLYDALKAKILIDIKRKKYMIFDNFKTDKNKIVKKVPHPRIQVQIHL